MHKQRQKRVEDPHTGGASQSGIFFIPEIKQRGGKRQQHIQEGNVAQTNT